MGDKTKKYQLCRMILVNAGTNKHVASAKITAIDPRGGAAVLGDNGVGKTTTLRILPLFFGHLPSQIVAAGHGNEAMVRFILPTDASAIVFEYQRGSDSDDDLRLAVIRRRADDPDVPFYRLYRSGFRKEIFVSDGRFLSDDETQVKATELGIQTTSKLTTAEYRSVILRTTASSKDKDKLRRYALEWSFGPKQLDNLDRVVAAMVKKHINFADIIQVAVGLVQHDLGLGAERAKLTFKQGRGPIERWLSNRDACVAAFKLAPTFAELESDLRDHRNTEARFRACRTDVASLTQARNQEASTIQDKLEAMAASRETVLEEERGKRATLTEAARSAEQIAASSRAAFNEASEKAKRFEDEKAAHWEQKIQELPTIRTQIKALAGQISAAEAVQGAATAEYERLASEAKTKASDLCLTQEGAKEPHRLRHTNTLSDIAKAEEDALEACDAVIEGRRLEIEEALGPLQESLGTWENRRTNPTASDDALQAVQKANDRKANHSSSLLEAQEAAAKAKEEAQAAQHAFAQQELEIRKARSDVVSAQSEREHAQQRLSPPDGTLLGALRSNLSDDWTRNLAKLINPELLSRDDLEPTFVEDASETAYGWQFHVGLINAPDWTDDSTARQTLDLAMEKEAKAQAHLNTQVQLLERCGQLRDETSTAFNSAEAQFNVLRQQTADVTNQLDAANQRVTNEKRLFAEQAGAEASKIRSSIGELKRQRDSLQADLKVDRQKVRTAHQLQRNAAKALCDGAIQAIDAHIESIKSDLQRTLESLKEQMNAHLSSAGVDVDHLEQLRGRLSSLKTDAQALEDRQALVASWNRWLQAGGPTRLETLRSASAKAATDVGIAAGKLTAFNQAAELLENQYKADIKKLEDRHADVERDLKILVDLDGEFGDYLAVGMATVSPNASAKELRTAVHSVQHELRTLEETINRRSSTLRQALTAKNSAVKDFVEASIGTDVDAAVTSDLIGRASALSICFKQIGPQVANDVNLTLKTLLANIGAFHKAIKSFEKQVSDFNDRLKAGLSGVQCFERVKDLRLDIVTRFEDLGFYKKLSRMEDIVRQHANELGKDYTRDLPPDETARALGDFMSVLGSDGNVEVNLSQHITLKGSVVDNGRLKEFRRANELQEISSEGLTSLILITLMTALLNTIRGSEPVHVPWVTDEVGKFDPTNFKALMQRLKDNRIDVVTASPELGPAQQAMFAKRYMFEDRGRIREYRPLETVLNGSSSSPDAEVLP